MLGPQIVGGNTIEDLQNGDEIFPAMLDAIHVAKISINLESTIYSSGKIGTAFTEALIERARAGVPVNVLLDAVGRMMIVDRQIVTVGSTNFHGRSFSLNDEANLNVYDANFAEHLTRVFERDLAHSDTIDPAQWRLRPWRQKILERFVALLNPRL